MPMPERIADKRVVKRYDDKLFGNEQHLYRDEQHETGMFIRRFYMPAGSLGFVAIRINLKLSTVHCQLFIVHQLTASIL
jgi:hypothetical protein